MNKQADAEQQIQAFFEGLNLRKLEQCEAALAELQALARTLPAYGSWCDYFRGILANERDRDWAEAERIFTSLLRQELDLPLRGRVLLALGRTCHYLGHWAEAIRAYEASLPVFVELNRPIDQAKSWKEIAISYRRGFTQGDFGPDVLEQAIEYCRLALAILEPMADPPPDVAWLEGSVWNTLGLVYRSLGRWNAAIDCFQHDLAICRSLDDRFGQGLSYGNLGEIYQKLGPGHWPHALESYGRALAIIREFDDPYEEIEVLANLGFLHQEMGEPQQALEYYQHALEAIETLRAQSSSDAARAGFLATVADVQANAILLYLQTGDLQRAFDTVERARARAFLDALAARSSELARRMAAPTVTLDQVQAALPPDALLLEFFTVGLVEAAGGRPGPDAERHRFPPACTLAFAVTCGVIRAYNARISPNDLRPRRLHSAAERHFLKPDVRRTLYERLLVPIEDLLWGKSRLYLVPHGPLHYIPFQALLAPDGEPLLREEGPRLVHAPSATLLFHPAWQDNRRATASCLAVGYNGEGAGQMALAEEEARSVSKLLDGDVLFGPSPKKAFLFDRAAEYRLLHLSCHGQFDPGAPLSSALCLAARETLTAQEVIEELRLECELVTLSACESGLSRVRRSDELEGLLRAFLHAGAHALVSTLWRVDERSTLILMERFYQGIRAGLSFAEALHQAQLRLRSLPQFADPYHWAPFMLVGRYDS